jgi:hypothetical protein
MAYEFIEFPKCKYHATKACIVVQSKDEEIALGGDWGDLPVDLSGSCEELIEKSVDLLEQAETEISPKRAKRSKA